VSRRGVFVAGAHTDVGKTHVACALISALRARGLAIEALKPVVSGFDPADWTDSDPGRLLAALGRPRDAAGLEAMSPWRLRAPLAPPIAARREGARLMLAPVADFCRARLAATSADVMLVEGVGGLMSPIAESATGLDLMTALSLPAILVGGSYLGAISHLLTAAETLRAHGLPLVAVVVSQSADPAAPDLAETAGAAAEHLRQVPLIVAPRTSEYEWADTLAASVLAFSR
jgi:dethiobiotin synthetase